MNKVHKENSDILDSKQEIDNKVTELETKLSMAEKEGSNAAEAQEPRSLRD